MYRLNIILAIFSCVIGSDWNISTVVSRLKELEEEVIELRELKKEVQELRTWKASIQTQFQGNAHQRRLLLSEHANAHGIAFSAYMSASFSAPDFGFHHTLIYDKIECNNGNGYDYNTGIFRPPSTGIYAFTWTTCASGDVASSELGIELIINGKMHGSTYVDTHTMYEQGCATGFIIHSAKTGDDVFMRSMNDSLRKGIIRSDKYARATFSGWLLF